MRNTVVESGWFNDVVKGMVTCGGGAGCVGVGQNIVMAVDTRGRRGVFFFFFNDTATTEIYTLSLHDALPISPLC